MRGAAFRVQNVGRWLILVSCVGAVAVGCGGDESNDAPASSPLLETTPLDPGEECDAGGQRVRAGSDRNGDAKLQDSEVTDELVICNGAPGADGADGLPGPQGRDGQDGKNGKDGQDGDQGEKGDTGAQGTSSLLKLTPVAAGAPCCAGGVRLETGLDTNGNGVLDPSEVDATQTQHVCNAAPDGVTYCKHLFVTAETYTGDLGGVTGADAKCNSDANKPNDSNYKALLVDGSARRACTSPHCSDGGLDEHLDWVLTPNTGYYRADGTTLIAKANTLGLWPFPLSNTYDLPENSPGLTAVWTGLYENWQVGGGTCLGWSTESIVGTYGLRDERSLGAIHQGDYPCSTQLPLVCVEQ